MPKTLASTKEKLASKDKTSPKSNPPKKSSGRTKKPKQPKVVVERCGSCGKTKDQLDEEDETLWEDGTFCKNYGKCNRRMCKECVEAAWEDYGWCPAHSDDDVEENYDDVEEALYDFEANELRCETCTPDRPKYVRDDSSSSEGEEKKEEKDDDDDDDEKKENEQ
jgi:hypothetical protein